MKRYYLILVVFSLSYIQGIDPNWSDEAKNIFYQTEKISPEEAVLYQLAVPVPFFNLGYAYSDNWKKGLQLDLYNLGSIIGAAIMLEEECEYNYMWHYNCEQKNAELGELLVLTSIGLSIYKIINAYNLAEKYNDNLFNRVFGDSRPSFSIGYSSSNNEPRLAFHIPLK